MRKTKEQNGITLIALIITIVVLLILAGVAIGTLDKSNIIGRAKEAAAEYEKGQADENALMADFESYLKENGLGGTVADKWNSFKQNPELFKHPDQDAKNGNRAIGTDGTAVNMDNWNYINLEEEEEFEGQKVVVLTSYTLEGSENYSSGYTGGFTSDGQIIGSVPQYIKIDGKEGIYTVVAMEQTFIGLEDLKIAPEIPQTVKYLSSVFEDCINLKKAPIIPASVVYMDWVFDECDNLEGEIIVMTEYLEGGYISWSLGCNENVTIKVKKGSQALAAIERIVAGCAGYKVKVEAFE